VIDPGTRRQRPMSPHAVPYRDALLDARDRSSARRPARSDGCFYGCTGASPTSVFLSSSMSSLLVPWRSDWSRGSRISSLTNATARSMSRGNDASAIRGAPPSVLTNAAVDRLTRVASLGQLAWRRGGSVLQRVTPNAAHSTPAPAYAMTPKIRKPPKLSEVSSGISTMAKAAQ
jgi:hypothetical protein